MYILIGLTNQRAMRATLSTLVSHDFIVVNTALSRSCISHVWLLMLIIFICAEPAALGTLGLVKGLVRTYLFSLYIVIAYLILICADPCK